MWQIDKFLSSYRIYANVCNTTVDGGKWNWNVIIYREHMYTQHLNTYSYTSYMKGEMNKVQGSSRGTHEEQHVSNSMAAFTNSKDRRYCSPSIYYVRIKRIYRSIVRSIRWRKIIFLVWYPTTTIEVPYVIFITNWANLDSGVEKNTSAWSRGRRRYPIRFLRFRVKTEKWTWNSMEGIFLLTSWFFFRFRILRPINFATEYTSVFHQPYVTCAGYGNVLLYIV